MSNTLAGSTWYFPDGSIISDFVAMPGKHAGAATVTWGMAQTSTVYWSEDVHTSRFVIQYPAMATSQPAPPPGLEPMQGEGGPAAQITLVGTHNNGQAEGFATNFFGHLQSFSMSTTMP